MAFWLVKPLQRLLSLAGNNSINGYFMPASNINQSPQDFYALATEALQQNQLDAAESWLDQELESHPQNITALELMADVYIKRRNQKLASDYLAQAVSAAPDDILLQKKFLKTAGGHNYKTKNDIIERAVMRCLGNPAISHIDEATPLWVSTLRLRPDFNNIFLHVTKNRFFKPRHNLLRHYSTLRPLLDPYFLIGIQKSVLCWLQFEQFIVTVRGFVLEQYFETSPRLKPNELLQLSVALSTYAFNTDYILAVSPAEQNYCDNLLQILSTNTTQPLDPTIIALLACYQPLHALTNIEQLEKQCESIAALKPVFQLQLEDFRQLQKVLPSIINLSAIDDITSIKVREQYEAFPYPRWTHLENFSGQFNNIEIETLSQPDIPILIAGCGTGLQSCLLARQFPAANILALDLTKASLAYAHIKAEHYGFKNIIFRQADILALGEIKQSFDYISCFGVLHHMQEPEQGWANLVRLLKPNGLMDIGLYSKYGRRSVRSARQCIAKKMYPATPQGMRSFRQKSKQLLSRSDFTTLTNWLDYFSLNMYRDLLFHAHEDQFDIPRLQKAMQTLGLTFTGFKLPASVLEDYKNKYPADVHLDNLDNWHQYEQSNPDTFVECYKFLCRKK
jgi:2-polyprenyl-3-methyl-5-hydroxy-6-metoxy-1,4-benzoquinol methylase